MAELTDFLTRDQKAFVQRGAAEIVQHYGLGHQMLKLVEECGEYQQAWVKHKIDPTEANYRHCLEEMADIQVLMLEILDAMPEFDSTQLALIGMTKIGRELERIENKKAHHATAHKF